MTKTAKAADYTHSVWTGKKYEKPQTTASLAAESMAVLAKHPTIGHLIANPITAEQIAALFTTHSNRKA